MAFGSFWDGLKITKLDNNMLKLSDPQEWHPLWHRPELMSGKMDLKSEPETVQSTGRFGEWKSRRNPASGTRRAAVGMQSNRLHTPTGCRGAIVTNDSFGQWFRPLPFTSVCLRFPSLLLIK